MDLQRFPKRSGRDGAVITDWQPGHLGAFVFGEPLHCVEEGMVLNRRGDYARAALIGVAPVREDARILGTLYVRSDLSAVYDRVMFYTLVALLVIALALLVAWAIARRLQRQLSAPILELAGTARQVSDRHDYRVRARDSVVVRDEEFA